MFTPVTLPIILLSLALQGSVSGLPQTNPDDTSVSPDTADAVALDDTLGSDSYTEEEGSSADNVGEPSTAIDDSSATQGTSANEQGSTAITGEPTAVAGASSALTTELPPVITSAPEPTTAYSTSESTASTATTSESAAPTSFEIVRGDVNSAPLVQLRLFSDTSKCLAVSSPEPKIYDPVSVVDCSLIEERSQWRYVDGLTQVKSALNGGQAWCLDGGEANWLNQNVTINACKGDIASQMWWYTGKVDGHFAMYNQSRCLDLRDGSSLDGGQLQTWPCFFGNSNQMWMATPA